MRFGGCFPCFDRKNEDLTTKISWSNVDLSREQFPEVWQHERTLEELCLDSTRITALPPQLFYCQYLQKLSMKNNNLDSIPDAIGTLQHLYSLDLSRNLLSTLPNNMRMCKNLVHLDLSCNNLQRLPEAITNLILLQELILNETSLEFLPANFGRLVNLRILELRLNFLITLPKSISRLCNLQRIDLGGNEFQELPQVIGELRQLRELWIDLNYIRQLSNNLGNLIHIQHFEAHGNSIEKIPNDISKWSHIEVISLTSNNISSLSIGGEIMKYLVTLKCESNSLQELPDSISNIENLEELILSHNKLSCLPQTIGLLRKLSYLFVDDNKLIELPNEICSCSNLTILDISCNQITQLPQNIGHLTNIRVLNLIKNNISALPVSILSLVNLKSLWISDNQSQPLVPLQYLNPNSKTQLTCFMLPQSKNCDGIGCKTNSNLNSVSYVQNESTDTKVDTKSQNGTRKIYFVDEAKINNMKNDSSSPHYSINKAGNDWEVEARFVRSPTPTPKELHLMAKNMRSSKQYRSTALPTESSIESFDIKEARTRLLSYPYKNTTMLQQEEPQCSTSYQSPSLTDGLEINADTNNIPTEYNLSNMRQDIDYKMLDNIQHDNDNNIEQQHPPPYHIARNFTKKSTTELNNFEIVGRLAQHQNYQQFLSMEQNVEPIYIPNAKTYNIPEAERATYLRQNSPENIECNINTSSSRSHCKISEETDLVAYNSHHPLIVKNNNASIDKRNDDLANHNLNGQTQNKRPWLFGLHKNPRVIQISLRWETSIGFKINEIPGKEGVYVTDITPNTEAAKILCIDDKILEIDGNDISKMHWSQIDLFVSNLAEGLLNIMISRR